MSRECKYDAFISYRHIEPDKTIAAALQKMLETYVPPKSLREKGFQKWHLFRDETELPTSNNLGDDIRHALENSRFLIVICSPETRKSKWCMEEITYFKQLHGGSNRNILTLLVNGEASEVFPEELCCEIVSEVDADGNTVSIKRAIEPLAANVSAVSVKKSLNRLKTEFLRIAAPLMGCGYDDLFRREQRRRNQRFFAAAGVVISFLLCFGVYSSAMLMKISEQKKRLETMNTELLKKNSESLTNQAKYYLKNGQQFEAIRAAVEALPEESGSEAEVNIEAECVLAQASNAYVNNTQLIYNTFELSSEVQEIRFSSDDQKLFVYDENNYFYIIDVKQKKISSVQSFGEVIKGIYSQGNQIYILCEYTLYAADAETGEIRWALQSEPGYCLKNLYFKPESDLLAVFSKSYMGGYVYYVDINGELLSSVWIDTEEKSIAAYCGTCSADSVLYLACTFYEDEYEEYILYVIDPYTEKTEKYDLDCAESLQKIMVYNEDLYVYAGEYTNGEMICMNANDMKQKWRTSFTHEKIDLENAMWDPFCILCAFDGYEFLNTAVQYEKEVPMIVSVQGNSVVGIHRETGEIIVNYAVEDEIVSYGYSSEGGLVFYTETEMIYCPLNEDYIANFYSADYKLSPQTLVLREDLKTLSEPCKNVVYSSSMEIYAIVSESSSEVKLYDEARTCDNAEMVELPELLQTPAIIDMNEICLSDSGSLVYCYEDFDNTNSIRMTVYDGKNHVIKTDIPVCSREYSSTTQIGGIVRGSSVVLFNGETNTLCLYDLEGNVLDELNIEVMSEVGHDFFLREIEVSGDFVLLESWENGILIRVKENKLIQEKIVSTNNAFDFGGSFDINQRGDYVGKLYDPQEDAFGIQWGSCTGEMERVYEGEQWYTWQSGDISSLSISENGEKIIFIEHDQCIKIYDTDTREMITINFQVTQKRPEMIAMTADGKYILGISSDGTILRYSVEELGLTASMKTGLEADPLGLYSRMDFMECGETEYLLAFARDAVFFDYEKMQSRAVLNKGTFGTYNKNSRQLVVCRNDELQLQRYFTTSELIAYAEEYLEKYGNK